MSTPEDGMKDATLVFFGICAWDYLTSLWFEYRLITGKIRFRWQFIPYFLARYSLLTLVTSSIVDVVMDSPAGPLCSPVLWNVMLYLGFISLVFGTWNLLIRTLIIWGHHPLLAKIFSVVALAHLALALALASIERSLCIPAPPSVFSVTAFAITTAIIEFSILLLSLLGIRRASPAGESPLARLLKTQGIAYFAVVLLIQVSTIIVGLAHTDAGTRAWVGISGAALSPVLSCRLVTSTLSENGPSHESRTHRIDCFELSEGQGRNDSDGRITTCIDLDTTKDPSVC
ncbi:hypothetical protein BJ322DRAFT_785524 [Thelephora terrestris]|uniref:Uncharacterized protein n=1 Tax=Thelephora terrestris TaxID=56493 RepID=A0A9P6HGS2_9AGAM|nr:hypothetical protein BJ322DRAFT_785524 [Thelephora terrestris]